LCKKHGSYMCRGLLRILQNFAGNIPTYLKFVRKIPTHGTKCKAFFCRAGIISTNFYKCRNHSYSTWRNNSYTCRNCRNNSYILHHVYESFLQNSTVWESSLQNFLILPYTCRNHGSYTSVNFGTSQKSYCVL